MEVNFNSADSVKNVSMQGNPAKAAEKVAKEVVDNSEKLRGDLDSAASLGKSMVKKKAYEKPETEVLHLQNDTHLMAGSGPRETQGGTGDTNGVGEDINDGWAKGHSGFDWDEPEVSDPWADF